jgi:anthrone oxygenase-like protein
MVFKIARFVNLLLMGLLAGNEFGTWAAVHPALGQLSVAERVRAEQEVTRRYAKMMPFWMSSTILSCLPVLALGRRTSGFRYSLLGALCFATMLLTTFLGNVPINNRVLELSPEADGEKFVELRKRWDRLHTIRALLNVAGLGFLSAGTPARKDRP